MPRHRFYQIDVFTTIPLTGNALAVFPDADDLEPRFMQPLAREMNLSETTFVLASDAAIRRVRFFTPAAEIPLAGHPTIGTWWTLAELGRLDLPADGSATVTQETGAGVLPVHIRTAGGRPVEVTMVQAKPAWGPVVRDLPALSVALGGSPGLVADHPTPQVVSTALPQLMVPVASREALGGLPVGGAGGGLVDLLRSYGTDCAMLYAADTVAPGTPIHCRMFAPGLGVPEDPATGSAAGALGAFLVRHGVAGTGDGTVRLLIEQGIEIGRPSRIAVTVAADPDGSVHEVRVGGEAVTVIEGEVTL